MRFDRIPAAAWDYLETIRPSGFVVLAAVCAKFRYADSLADARAEVSVARLAERTGLQRRAVQLALRRLEAVGLLAVDRQDGRRGVSVYRMGAHAYAPSVQLDAPLAQADAPPAQEVARGGAPTCTGGAHADARSTESLFQNQGVEEKEAAPPAAAQARRPDSTKAEVRAVFDAWRASLPTGTGRSLTEGRATIIRARLAEHPLADCLDAAVGWMFDPWADRARCNDLTVLFRPENFEKFRDLARARKVNGGGAASAAPALALANAVQLAVAEVEERPDLDDAVRERLVRQLRALPPGTPVREVRRLAAAEVTP